jgi:hypothetical protein
MEIGLRTRARPWVEAAASSTDSLQRRAVGGQRRLLANHLIGARQERGAEILIPIAFAVRMLITRSNFVGCSTSEFARPGASQDAVDIRSGTPIEVLEARAVADEQTGSV